MVKLTINNKVVEAEEGTTILDAAVKADIYIPTLCYHESLSPEGSCRLCLVEVTVKGINGLVTACTYPVEAGIEVKTDSERVAKARQLTMEMLLAQRPHSAKLEELAREMGVDKPSFTLIQDECILCGLCVRTCHEVVGADAISFIDQGINRGVKEASVNHSAETCIGCDSCAYICPTDAIKVQDIKSTRRLTTPSGKLEFKLKICKTCGMYWAPEKQLEYIIKRAGLTADAFDKCPDCRD